MEYSIKKDSTPEETVFRIRKKLDENNIKTEVKTTSCGENYYSLSVAIANTHISVNGKGTSIINALASGYAELIERLQTQFLLKFDNDFYSFDVDEKFVSLNDCNKLNTKIHQEHLNVDVRKINELI